MDSVSAHINLGRIKILVSHNTAGYQNLNTAEFNFEQNLNELYSNLLKYYHQYHLKQKLYLLDEINCMDLERTHPIFHQKVAHKNREFTTGLFSDSPLKKQVIPGGSCAGILQRGMRERLGGSYYFTTRQRKGGSEERRGGSEGRSETGY